MKNSEEILVGKWPRVYRVFHGTKTWDILQFDGDVSVNRPLCMIRDQVNDSRNPDLLEAISRRQWEILSLQQAGRTLISFDFDHWSEQCISHSSSLMKGISQSFQIDRPWLKPPERRLLPKWKNKPS